MVQNRRTRRINEILTINKVEVRSIKYQRTVISNTNDGTEEIKARILAANNAYFSLKTVFRYKQIHRNNKIRQYKTLIKPVLCYRSVIWTLTQMAEQIICIFQR
jgi:hypothetical protein